MDKTMLIAMLMQQAPRLLSALKGNGGLEASPNIANSLEAGMDPKLMEERLLNISNRGQDYDDALGINVLENRYPSPAIELPFPSDGEGDGLTNLFADLTTKERQMIDGPEAALSVATFLNNPVQEIPEPEIDSPFILGNDGMHQGDEDFLHSNEIWDSGLAYRAPWNKLIKKKS